MIFVSNASPLVNLARIGRLELLQELFGEVCLPDAVWAEVVVAGEGQPGARLLAQARWVARRQVQNHSLVQVLRQELDAGEAEAIVLALELKADLLLMDERLGRETAQHLGLKPIGVIGVLIEAKRRGVLPEVRPLLDTLRDQAGFRVSERLYARVLVDIGEGR
jgi:predicted nucleic acid-binding protein